LRSHGSNRHWEEKYPHQQGDKHEQAGDDYEDEKLRHARQRGCDALVAEAASL
jgi:hypothetical protein